MKPCPFCGSEKLTFHTPLPYVSCDECGAWGPYNPEATEAEAVSAWNRRTEAPTPPPCDAAMAAWEEER
jgi:Lar family restriction alleviation protein